MVVGLRASFFQFNKSVGIMFQESSVECDAIKDPFTEVSNLIFPSICLARLLWV